MSRSLPRAFQRAGGALSDFRFEACALVLIVLTFAAIAWQDLILRRTFTIDGTNASSFLIYGYGDEANGGGSYSRSDPKLPLSWDCELRGGFAYPYCGKEVLFDPERYERGMDLSGMETLTLDFSYEGTSEHLRMHLKNHDPRYSVPGKNESNKFNKVDFPARNGPQRVVLKIEDFSVADWWLTNNKIPPELSRPQFDNVISMDLQTGVGSELGTHRFRIHRITLEGWALTPAQWYLGILSAWLALIGLFLAYRIARLKRDLSTRQAQQVVAMRQVREAEEAARRDALTGLLNRSGVAACYQEMLSGGCATVSVLLIDADHFKSLNDRFGHNYGDEVLSSLAQILKRNVGAEDIVGRWGGEEFIVICKDADERAALGLANKLRSRIEHFHFGECETVTASFGVCWEARRFEDLAELVDRADTALYMAKQRGRNRSVIYHSFMKKAA